MKHSLVLCIVSLAAACAVASDPEQDRLRETTVPTYDDETGRLRQITYDSRKDGIVDTWAYMDGVRVVRVETDESGDGQIDRWEYYDDTGRMEKVGYSRARNGVPDSWAFAGDDRVISRIEMAMIDPEVVNRWEFYMGGRLTRVEEDTTGDGRIDKWETYETGVLVTAAFDENADGRPDRRLTYGPAGALLTIESQPDASGAFTRRLEVREGAR